MCGSKDNTIFPSWILWGGAGDFEISNIYYNIDFKSLGGAVDIDHNILLWDLNPSSNILKSMQGTQFN